MTVLYLSIRNSHIILNIVKTNEKRYKYDAECLVAYLGFFKGGYKNFNRHIHMSLCVKKFVY